MSPRHSFLIGCRLFLVAWLLLAVAPAHAQRPQRYAGMLANGQRIAGDKLSDWHNADAKPRLDNQPLLDAGNPLKWLRDRALPLAALPTEYVETHTGDILPGTVVDFRSGQELPFDPLPAHLVVEPAIAFSPPGKPTETTVRVVSTALKRVVWQQRSRHAYEPGTIFFRDGRSFAYRALRFGPGFVTVLLESGSQKTSWSDLAEVHFPQVDFWPTYYDELAGLCATSSTRLLQLETASGLIATTSLDRFVPRFDGNPQESERWVHGIQPAWSLDILWVPCREIAMRRSFAAHQVPLSRVPPAKIVSQSLLAGSGRPPQTNRNVFGGPLQSAEHDFGWGIGAQARSELSFDLPEGVKSLRGSVSIDRTSGAGGCVKCRLFATAVTTPPLWESPLLVGSTTVADFSTIPLAGPAAGQKQLVLQIDPAHDGRPAGADPLDIRDAANWLDLLLELDPAEVQRQLDQRLDQRLAAWNGASVRLEPAASDPGLQISYLRRESGPPPSTFDSFVGHPTRGIVIEKTFTLKPADQWLVLSAFRHKEGEPPKLEIRIGDEPVAEYEPPPAQNDPNDVRPLAIPLAPYQRPGGAAIRVSVRQRAIPKAAPLAWRTFQVTTQLPTLYRAYEDETNIATLAGAIVEDAHHHGTRSLRVAAGQKIELPLGAPVAIRERPKWGEYRFLRFAVRKQGAGRIAVTLGSAPARNELARYDGGQGEPVDGKSLRIWNEPLTDKWVVLTRDLYADFGATDWTSLSLACPDGEAAWFDHIYLARGPEDFKLITAAPSAEATNQKAREELARQSIDRVRPTLVTLQLPGGEIAAGCITHKQGEILTAGHFLRAPNQDLTVRLADGKTAKARSLGISRELDLGLVKISDMGKWPTAEISSQKEMDPHVPYAALIFAGNAAADAQPQLMIASLRRSFRTTLWTDADAESFTPGGVLVSPRGQIVGLHIRQSQFSGFLFTRLSGGEVKEHLERMRRGEIFGAWPAGSEPLLGLEGKPTSAGLEVTSTSADGPAAKAGVMPSDVLVRLSSKPIVSMEDVSAALSQSDAGQSVALELVRSGALVNASAVLAPRSP
jgi:S1-C subfamily serine protease